MSPNRYKIRWSSWIGVAATTLAVMLVTASTVSANVIDRIVAQVNDEIVTLYELEEAALPYLVQYGQNPAVLQNEQQREQVLADVLDDLIDRMLIEEEAARMDIHVTEEQIEEWMTMTAQQQNMTESQFRQAIGQYGIDYDDYRGIVRDNLMRMQIVQMRAGGRAVSESEVESMYRRQYGAIEEMERRIEVRHILLIPDQTTGGEAGAVQRIEEMRQQILSGQASFEELAEAESQGPGADSGGNIGTFGAGELAESFEEVAFAQEVGVLSGPEHTEFGVHLIEVLDSQEQPNPQVQQRKEQIRAHLQEQEMERQMDSFLTNLRSRAFVDVRY